MDVLLENQKMTVERILALIQNILQVPADPKEEMRNDDDASVHDQVSIFSSTSLFAMSITQICKVTICDLRAAINACQG